MTGDLYQLCRAWEVRNTLLRALAVRVGPRRDCDKGCLRCGRALVTKRSIAVHHCVVCRAES